MDENSNILYFINKFIWCKKSLCPLNNYISIKAVSFNWFMEYFSTSYDIDINGVENTINDYLGIRKSL